MVADRALIAEIEEKQSLRMNYELELYLLKEYGSEPFLNEWSKEHLWIQIPKIVDRYWSGQLKVRLKSPFEKLSDQHEILKDMYLEKLSELNELTEYLFQLEELIKDHNLELPECDIDF